MPQKFQELLFDNIAIISLWWATWTLLDDFVIPQFENNKMLKVFFLFLVILVATKKIN